MSVEKKLIKILVGISLALLFFNIVNKLMGEPSWQIARLIDPGFESNLATWFSSMLLAIAPHL